MANPSRATLVTEGGKIVEIIDRMRQAFCTGSSFYPAANANNLLTDINALQTAMAGDWLDDQESVTESIRGHAAAILSQSMYAGALRPWLRQFCKSVIGRTNLSDDTTMWQEMYKYCVDNSFYVQSRAMTYGTPTAAGANVGNNQIVRLTRDRYNFPMESGYVDSKRALCVADASTGTALGKEQFVIAGQASARDQLERSGSGLSGSLIGQTIDDSVLNNAGFRAFSGTAAAPTGLTSWTSTAGDSSSVYTLDSTNYFRAGPSDGSTSYALKTAASSRFQQLLSTARSTELNVNSPYLMAVVWNRAINGASGTLNVRMGAVTTSVTVSAQTGWNVTLCPSNVPNGFSCWYRQFAQNSDITFEVEWIQTAAGLLIGEVLVLPGTYFDGTYYWCIPASVASYIPSRVNDSYTWPDLATGSAKWQNSIMRGYPGTYLPSANGSGIGLTEPS